ncbi:Transglycosylase-associated protein [Isosphaera pallida ATCC 43644]|uniref:Transglycosylase-associated protein n=2 Tax=Isosphaera pallida TaxID=128 RepID=E8R375_ISOPI|nr:Transglycosylase-associated protein [Isosphaera pallida ATCC 43644]
MMSLVWFLLVGLVAGSVAVWIRGGPDRGWIGNMVLGIVGALVGGFLFQLLGFTTNSLLGELISAVVGALVFLWALKVISKST